MKKIAEALAALIKATPAHYITIIRYDAERFGVGFAHETDDAARKTAAEFEIDLVTKGNANEQWLTGEADVGDVRVSVYGPHHPRAVDVDSDTVDAALAQAEEAVRR